jgi:hypothetical protein
MWNEEARRECEGRRQEGGGGVWKEEGGPWRKHNLSKLPKKDSLNFFVSSEIALSAASLKKNE